MEIVKLTTESYLFQDSDSQFRALPFYELSIDEWIVYQNSRPKYLVDFNRRTKPVIQYIRARLDAGENLENVVVELGKLLGQEWTTKHKFSGEEIANSQQVETVELELFDSLDVLLRSWL